MTTPKDGAFLLHVPAGTKQTYETAIVAIPRDKRVWWHYHKVASGDTLASLAKKYHTTAPAIAQANNLEGEELGRQQRLIIPVNPGSHSAALAFSKRATPYTVRKGDTVESIADDFSVPVTNLRKWNKLKGNTLKVGRVLSIHKPLGEGETTQTASARSGKTHVKSAEVADEQEDAPAPCTKWGRQSRHRVCLVRAKSQAKAPAKPPAKTASPKLVHHTVRKGETLKSIASTYNTTVTALKRDNRKVAANLKPGSILIVKPSTNE